jgi:hypothetical protein
VPIVHEQRYIIEDIIEHLWSKPVIDFSKSMKSLFYCQIRLTNDILHTMVSTETEKFSVLGITCLLITAAILIAGLWPFNVNPVNKVERLQNRNGIRFYGQGMVVSRQPLEIGTFDAGNGTITIELFVRPTRESNHTVTSILTLYGHDREQFIIGQWKTHLVARVLSLSTDNHKRYREIGVSNVLIKDATHLIALVSEKEATDIYIDGKLNEHLPNFSLIPDGLGLSGYLILGNSPAGAHSWNGAFLGLAIYDRSVSDREARDHYHEWKRLGQPRSNVFSKPAARQQGEIHLENTGDTKKILNSAIEPLQNTSPLETSPARYYRGRPSDSSSPIALYLFDERNEEQIGDHSGRGNDLLMPKIFIPLRRTVFGIPDKYFFFSRSNLKDIAINIAGFIPFGFFLSAWLRFSKNLTAPRVYGISLFLGFILSLAIELAQAYFPTRDSSLMDVTSNTLGTAAGIWIFKSILPFFYTTIGTSFLLSRSLFNKARK